MALVRARAGRAAVLRKAEETSIPLFGSSPAPLWPNDPQRTRTADRVLEQLEPHSVADLKIVERGALPQVATMKVDLAAARQPDKSMPLARQDPDDSAGRGPAARIMRPGELARRSRRIPARRIPGPETVEIFRAHTSQQVNAARAARGSGAGRAPCPTGSHRLPARLGPAA